MQEPSPRPSQPTRVVLLPSVSGGIGHISRCAALARALRRLEPAVDIQFVLDAERLRPFNVEATRRMGFEPKLLAPRARDNRDAIVRECFGNPDIVVDDVARYLLPLRQAVPQAAWVTIAMHPIGDELFMDWPLMAQMQAVIWPYAPLVGMPPELQIVADKVVSTGPFLETDQVPDKAAARAALGLHDGEQAVVYAPRGFPFGREFGHRVLGATFEAVQALRQGACPGLRLVLLAVNDPAELQGVPGLPAQLPDWVQVKGVVTPQESLLHAQAACVLIGEGTSTMHEGAALRTPLVLVPGPIQEATLLAHRLGAQQAGALVPIESVDAAAFAQAFVEAIEARPEALARLERAHALVTGGGGVVAAARLVLGVAARHGQDLGVAAASRDNRAHGQSAGNDRLVA